MVPTPARDVTHTLKIIVTIRVMVIMITIIAIIIMVIMIIITKIMMKVGSHAGQGCYTDLCAHSLEGILASLTFEKILHEYIEVKEMYIHPILNFINVEYTPCTENLGSYLCS